MLMIFQMKPPEIFITCYLPVFVHSRSRELPSLAVFLLLVCDNLFLLFISASSHVDENKAMCPC